MSQAPAGYVEMKREMSVLVLKLYHLPGWRQVVVDVIYCPSQAFDWADVHTVPQPADVSSSCTFNMLATNSMSNKSVASKGEGVYFPNALQYATRSKKDHGMIFCYRISYKLVHISGRLDQYKVQYFLFLLSEFVVKRHASTCTFRFHACGLSEPGIGCHALYISVNTVCTS